MRRFESSPKIAVLGAVLAGVALVCASGPSPAQQAAQSPQAPAAESSTQEQRLQRIEEHLLDLNTIVGTLQSLVSQGQVASQQQNADAMVPPQTATQPGADSGDLGQRVDVIETQIRALSGQIEHMSGQLSQIQAALVGSGQLQQQETAPTPQPDNQQGQLAPLQEQAAPAAQQQLQQPQQQQTFGTVTVQPDQPAATTPQQPALQPQQQQPAATPPQQQAALQSNPDARAAYDAAYNFLLRRDFKSAEAGFSQFLQAHPNDPLAGNAQYWLGETYYVRGAYRQAADAFLAGYRKYRNSDKAPANLLKLGMSLHQLGETDAACATFSELANKYPSAPAHLKQRAASERQRTGCP